MQQIIASILLLFFFSGCSSLVKESDEGISFKHIQFTNSTNFEWVTGNLLKPLCKEIQKRTQGIMPIYVVDFVNLNSLKNQSQLGFILSNNIKTQVTQKCKTPIYSLEYAKYLKMGDQGSKLLTRDTQELATKKINKNTYALVGSYAITQRQLITYLKLIDLKSGLILKSATDQSLLNDEVLRLESTNNNHNKTNIKKPFSL